MGILLEGAFYFFLAATIKNIGRRVSSFISGTFSIASGVGKGSAIFVISNPFSNRVYRYVASVLCFI